MVEDSASFDVHAVRGDFPILARTVYDAPLVYLDNAASAQKPVQVIKTMTDVLEQEYANVHRGLHYLSNAATARYEAARETTAAFLGAARKEEIVFTSGGTDAFNLVAAAIGVDIQPGDEIVLSVMEHHSNIVPWHLLRERRGAVLKWVDISDDGAIDLDQFKAAFSERTKIAAVTHMSNVLGRRTPGRELADIAHETRRGLVARWMPERGSSPHRRAGS